MQEYDSPQRRRLAEIELICGNQHSVWLIQRGGVIGGIEKMIEDSAGHEPLNATWEIDGAWGEGGGQLIRTAVALAAITHTPIRVPPCAPDRQPPGLALRRLTAMRAVAMLRGGETRGLEPRIRHSSAAWFIGHISTHREQAAS